MCVAKYKARGSLVKGLTDQFNAPVPYLKNNVIIYVGLLLLGTALEAKCSFVVQPEISRGMAQLLVIRQRVTTQP